MIREIYTEEIVRTVRRLCIEACCLPAEGLSDAIRAARAAESGAAATVLGQIEENHALAAVQMRPGCQDTGMTVVFADLGRDAHLDGDLYAAVNEGVRRGYTEGYMRKSVTTALTRENTGDNTPAVVHLRLVEGDRLHLTVLPKGFGSENKSRIAMLTPADGIAGVEEFIVETVRTGGASACPPLVVGVGIGGTFDSCALLAKRQLARRLGSASADPMLADMERRLLERMNGLDIGPMGLGGKTSVLAVHIAQEHTHIAGLPVAVNIQCHALRHAEAII